jgi:hypothetical protein
MQWFPLIYGFAVCGFNYPWSPEVWKWKFLELNNS